MSLKRIVNDVAMHKALMVELDERIELHQKKLEQAQDLVTIHRAQGAIRLLRDLKQLREKVNGPDNNRKADLS